MSPQPALAPPSRPLRSKRESLTITPSVGKALADVMNREKGSYGAANTGATLASTFGAESVDPASGRVATTREGARGSRPSLELIRSGGNDKVTPKLVKRPPTAPSSFPSKPTTREDKDASGSHSKPSEKSSKSRTSLTLRGLSSALQVKSTLPMSALPKYKPKPHLDTDTVRPRSSVRKRLSDRAGETDEPKDEAKGSEEDVDDDFVTVERPISPLPRRGAGKHFSSPPLSLAPSTSSKRGNVLHKTSSSISSTPPRASKVPKASPAHTTPTPRLHNGQSSVPRPTSSTSTNSRCGSPAKSPTRKPVSASRTMPSMRSVRRRPTIIDDTLSSKSRLDASPGTPFLFPETSGMSLLSPPLSPFLEGVSLDSIDAGDVSALLSTVVSPPSKHMELPSQTPSRLPSPEDQSSSPPQTPVSESSLRPPSLTSDPRQSMLSLRQFLENSGDLEHLLSQPLPVIFTPDARERLLSFGFSPDFAPPPFPPGAHRPEPQTPSPVPGGQSFTSISQVLFPQSGEGTQKSRSRHEALVERLNLQLASAEAQRAERDVRIEKLEEQVLSLREAREQEAAELSTQVSHLEERLQELLADREREKVSEWGKEDLEARLRDKDAEWERRTASLVAQMQEQGLVEEARHQGAERRKWVLHRAAAAWESARTMALNELELVRTNKVFVEITLAGIDLTMQQSRL